MILLGAQSGTASGFVVYTAPLGLISVGKGRVARLPVSSAVVGAVDGQCLLVGGFHERGAMPRPALQGFQCGRRVQAGRVVSAIEVDTNLPAAWVTRVVEWNAA